MNAARLFTSALRESEPGEDQRHLGERVDASRRAAEDLLDGLLDISRLDADELKPELTEFDAAELLRDLQSQYMPVARKRGLSLRIHVPGGLHIRSDRRLLRRALQNFAANAMRYTRDGGVLLAARTRGDEVELQVWDTGPLIPPQHLDQIFEEFRRFAQRGRGSRGLGLGLSICQRIARTLGHRLLVRSRVYRGSLFAIIVPRVSSPAPAPNVATEARHAAEDLAGLRVLCIDNDPDILDGMRTLLARWSVDVQVAANVEQALCLLTGHRPQVVLADYHIHDRMQGPDLIDALRERAGANLPAALITGYGSEEVKQAARSRGVVLLTKPVKPASLRAFLAAQRG